MTFFSLEGSYHTFFSSVFPPDVHLKC